MEKDKNRPTGVVQPNPELETMPSEGSQVSSNVAEQRADLVKPSFIVTPVGPGGSQDWVRELAGERKSPKRHFEK